MHSSGMCPIDPPPYRPYDDPNGTQHDQSSNLFSRQWVSSGSMSSGFERHPAPVIPCILLPNIERHHRTFDPPPYSG